MSTFSRSTKTFLSSASILLALALASCSADLSGGDELEFTGLISGSEECFTYPFGDSVNLQAEFINTAGGLISQDSLPQLGETYSAVFYQDLDQIEGVLVPTEDTVGPGETGTMYLNFTRSEFQKNFRDVTRIEILKGEKVLLASDVSIDLGSLCVDSTF